MSNEDNKNINKKENKMLKLEINTNTEREEVINIMEYIKGRELNSLEASLINKEQSELFGELEIVKELYQTETENKEQKEALREYIEVISQVIVYKKYLKMNASL